jgi:hypothetical protein
MRCVAGTCCAKNKHGKKEMTDKKMRIFFIVKNKKSFSNFIGCAY